MKPKVYFISGLGADSRSFSLLDLDFCEPVYIEWIKPRNKESLKEYALRLREQIDEPAPRIVGLSFGGMLTTEMAKADPSIRGILLSSNKTSKEFPSYLRTGKYLPVYRWLPPALFKRAGILSRWFIGPKSEEQRKLFREILRDSDASFTQWAISAILHWKNEEVPPNIIHIHGTADRLLPFNRVKADYAIQGGTHVIPINNAEEVSELLRRLL